jgi:2-polyprenyl-6-methoxyphenol hydroxylase-like FAD-dependent oxidoreductase
MGMYVATVPVDGYVDDERYVTLYNVPGRLVSVHPTRGHALAAFMFRSPGVPGFDHRDTEQHKRLVTSAFAGAGWRVPELLYRVRTASDVYFDSVSQVRLARWSDGRIAVLGDAASSLSLFGDGSTLAIAGAYTLAQELAAARTDHRSALDRYEARHRRLVEPRQRGFATARALLIPATRAGIAARNIGVRLSPVVTAAGSLRRRLRPARRPAAPGFASNRAAPENGTR